MVDRPTAAACGVIAWTIAVLAHQIAHAAAAAGFGGRLEAITVLGIVGRWGALDTAGTLFLYTSGTLANLVVLGLSWWVMHLRASTGPVRALAWLTFSASGWIAAGHLVLSPLLGVGDWIAVVDLFANRGPLRASVFVTGLFVCAVLRKGTFESLARVAGGGSSSNRVAGARRLSRSAWSAGALVLTIGGMATSVVGPEDALAFHVGLDASALNGALPVRALVAGIVGFGFATLPVMLVVPGIEERPVPGPPLVLDRSVPLLVAGIVAALVVIFVFGPGVTVRPG